MRFFTTSCIILIIIILAAPKAEADDDLNIKIGAYVDAYIASDGDSAGSNPASKGRPYSANDFYKDEFALNIAQISAITTYKNIIRSNVTLQAGSLPLAAYGTKNPNVQQANLGVQLFRNVWLDAGYFLTHIGNEALLPKDNWLTSHSMVTYFEPFYQAGAKVSYETDLLNAAVHILNGNGLLEDNNYNKTLGLYLGYNAGETFALSYAGVYGNEVPGNPSNAKLHMMHNISTTFLPLDKFGINAQVDYASLEDGKIEDGDTTGASYLGFSVTGRYEIVKKLSCAVRFTYFDNEEGLYEPCCSKCSGMGITGGLEYKPMENAYIRLEARMLKFNEGEEEDSYPGKVFYDGEEKTASRSEIMLNLGFWIN